MLSAQAAIVMVFDFLDREGAFVQSGFVDQAVEKGHLSKRSSCTNGPRMTCIARNIRRTG